VSGVSPIWCSSQRVNGRSMAWIQTNVNHSLLFTNSFVYVRWEQRSQG
jgi:hypothetical protein